MNSVFIILGYLIGFVVLGITVRQYTQPDFLGLALLDWAHLVYRPQKRRLKTKGQLLFHTVTLVYKHLIFCVDLLMPIGSRLAVWV